MVMINLDSEDIKKAREILMTVTSNGTDVEALLRVTFDSDASRNALVSWVAISMLSIFRSGFKEEIKKSTNQTRKGGAHVFGTVMLYWMYAMATGLSWISGSGVVPLLHADYLRWCHNVPDSTRLHFYIER